MKKQLGRKMVLSAERVRKLNPGDLIRIRGGVSGIATCYCPTEAASCGDTCDYSCQCEPTLLRPSASCKGCG